MEINRPQLDNLQDQSEVLEIMLKSVVNQTQLAINNLRILRQQIEFLQCEANKENR
jgi:hypothetical protein